MRLRPFATGIPHGSVETGETRAAFVFVLSSSACQRWRSNGRTNRRLPEQCLRRASTGSGGWYTVTVRDGWYGLGGLPKKEIEEKRLTIRNAGRWCPQAPKPLSAGKLNCGILSRRAICRTARPSLLPSLRYLTRLLTRCSQRTSERWHNGPFATARVR